MGQPKPWLDTQPLARWIRAPSSGHSWVTPRAPRPHSRPPARLRTQRLLRRRKEVWPNRRPQFPGRSGMEARFTRGKSALLERALARPRTEVSLSAFALLFSELVQHCQSRVFSVAELQARLAALGRQVGARVLDALVAREKGSRRETKVLGALLFVKGAVWKALFGKEADKLEQANDDARTFYIIEREPLINTYISVPKENSTLNCASFTAGIVEAVLTHSGFPAKVTAHWHKGTTLMIKFEEAVIARDRALEGR
ncbi:Hypothetical predicted protein [Marmota monax]|uniref:Trafficking protein particle complex subunit 5 n=1 Tax=Marmota monax TaxID=9995 RepID=A0A5E4CIB5_MARMO|nr:Hypothetical predicted protein [Marmota monax]